MAPSDLAPAHPAFRKRDITSMTAAIRHFLTAATYARKEVDDFVNEDVPQFAQFDPVLGWTPSNFVAEESGIDGAHCIYQYGPAGERRSQHGGGHKCRINTYGDSFNHGAQVSDGETWQEFLAAHFGEPLRNYGVGGYGVYQAYRRALREEGTTASAEYIVVNIFSGDHIRNIDSWRWLALENYRTSTGRRGSLVTINNPWCHVRLDPANGQLLEIENPYPSPKSLYDLCDEEHVYEAFKDDLMVQLLVGQKTGEFANIQQLGNLAEMLKVACETDTSKATAETCRRLYHAYGLRTTFLILQNAREFVEDRNKKLMVLLSYSGPEVVNACKKTCRSDQILIEFLREREYTFVDSLEEHVIEFSQFSISPEDYVKRYYIGHYSPQGNHFFAYAMKNAMVEWLDPKPLTYRKERAKDSRADRL